MTDFLVGEDETQRSGPGDPADQLVALFKDRAKKLQRAPDGGAGCSNHGVASAPTVALFLSPVAALILYVLFLGSGAYYVTHLVFSLHFHALYFLLLTIAGFFDGDWVPLWFLLPNIYIVVGMRTAYQSSWWAAVARLVIFNMVYGFVLIGTTAALVVSAIIHL